jgi:hypothetical protein
MLVAILASVAAAGGEGGGEETTGQRQSGSSDAAGAEASLLSLSREGTCYLLRIIQVLSLLALLLQKYKY